MHPAKAIIYIQIGDRVARQKAVICEKERGTTDEIYVSSTYIQGHEKNGHFSIIREKESRFVFSEKQQYGRLL